MKGIEEKQEFPRRWDNRWIEQRKALEVSRLGYAGPGDLDRPVSLPLHYRLFKWGLKAIGMYQRGHRNFTDLRLVELTHQLSGWPKALEGFRILQVSDLHIDLDPALLKPLCRILGDIRSDMVAFTGDFWEGTNTSFETALAHMDSILKAIPQPRHGFHGVLGNHDPAALGARLESMGISIMVNEAVTIEHEGAVFALAGIDDPYYFKLHDIRRAAAQCPASLSRILLSHSPQIAEEAAAAGFDLVLSGHTHGGQVCLPGGRSLVSMAEIPRSLFRGLWRCGSMKGYTSTGTGACHVPVRFNCPPEVVLHTIIGESVTGGHLRESS